MSIDVVREFLARKRPDFGEIGPDVDLIDNRIIDSLGFVDFLYLLEEHTGREIPMESVTPEDFRTISAIQKRFFSDEPR